MSLTYVEEGATSNYCVDPTRPSLNSRSTSFNMRDGSSAASCEDSSSDYKRLMDSYNSRSEILGQYRSLIEQRQQHWATERTVEPAKREDAPPPSTLSRPLDTSADTFDRAAEKVPPSARRRASPAPSDRSAGASGSRRAAAGTCTWVRPHRALAAATESFEAKRRAPAAAHPPAPRGPTAGARAAQRQTHSFMLPAQRGSKGFSASPAGRHTSGTGGRRPRNAARSPAHSARPSPRLAAPEPFPAVDEERDRAGRRWSDGQRKAEMREGPGRVSQGDTLWCTALVDVPVMHGADEILTEEDKREVEQQRSMSNKRLSGSASIGGNNRQSINTFGAPRDSAHSASHCVSGDREESTTRCERYSTRKSKSYQEREENVQPASHRNAPASQQLNSCQDWGNKENIDARCKSPSPLPSKVRSTQNVCSRAADPASTDATPKLDLYKAKVSGAYADTLEEPSRLTVVSQPNRPLFDRSLSTELNDRITVPTVSSSSCCNRNSAVNPSSRFDVTHTEEDKADYIAAVAGVLQGVLVQTRRVMPCYYCGELLALSAYHLHLDFCKSRTETLYARYDLYSLDLVSCEPRLPIPGSMSSHAEKKCFADACYQSAKQSIIPCPDCNAMYRIHDLPDHQTVCALQREFLSKSKSMHSSKTLER